VIQVEVFDAIYTFDTVHKVEIFVVDIVGKYFGQDHVGEMKIHIVEKPGNPPTLGINVGEDVVSKDVGPGRPQ
jgi:hypothetical protein